MSSKRFENIQVLRGVAVLLVLGRHMHICVRRLMDQPLSPDPFSMGDLGVDFFFVISGFVLTISTRAHLPNWRAARVFLYHRAARVFPLYWLYMLPTIWVYLAHREWLHRYDKDEPISVVKSLLLWPQRGMPMLGQGWSLTYELYYYLVFAGLLLLPTPRFTRGLLFWALGIALVNGSMALKMYWLPVCPEWWIVTNLQTVEFVAGALVGVIAQRFWVSRPRVSTGWLSIGAGLIWIAVVLLPIGFSLPAAARVIGYGAPALALVFGAVVLELNDVALSPVLARVGLYSYSIYLSHILVLNAIVQLWPWRKIHGWAAMTLLDLFMCGCAVGVGAVSYHLFEQPLLAWTRRWPARHRKTEVLPPASVLVEAGQGEANALL